MGTDPCSIVTSRFLPNTRNTNETGGTIPSGLFRKYSMPSPNSSSELVPSLKSVLKSSGSSIRTASDLTTIFVCSLAQSSTISVSECPLARVVLGFMIHLALILEARGKEVNAQSPTLLCRGLNSITNWQVTFSDIEGKPRTYNASFSCVKGSRILWLGETGYGRLE